MKYLPEKYCCERMRENLEYTCEMHPDPSDCPDIGSCRTNLADQPPLSSAEFGVASASLS